MLTHHELESNYSGEGTAVQVLQRLRGDAWHLVSCFRTRACAWVRTWSWTELRAVDEFSGGRSPANQHPRFGDVGVSAGGLWPECRCWARTDFTKYGTPGTRRYPEGPNTTTGTTGATYGVTKQGGGKKWNIITARANSGQHHFILSHYGKIVAEIELSRCAAR